MTAMLLLLRLSLRFLTVYLHSLQEFVIKGNFRRGGHKKLRESRRLSLLDADGPLLVIVYIIVFLLFTSFPVPRNF